MGISSACVRVCGGWHCQLASYAEHLVRVRREGLELWGTRFVIVTVGSYACEMPCVDGTWSYWILVMRVRIDNGHDLRCNVKV